MAIPPLIRPVLQGGELLDRMIETRPQPGRIAVWWLGQSGFLIKSSTGALLIDPYLSEHLTKKYAGTIHPHIRMTQRPIAPESLTFVDLSIATHKHSDHLDPETMPTVLKASPSCLLALPASLVEHAVGLGIDRERIRGVDAGDELEVAGFRARALPSAHEGLDTDDKGRHLYLGYVIEVEGLRLYHGGDTLVYDGLIDHLGRGRFDVVFVPINGRDPARGVAGNMTAAEAVDFATAIRPRFVVPHHYDMFVFNTVPVSDFETESRRLPGETSPRVLRCGETWEVGPWE